VIDEANTIIATIHEDQEDDFSDRTEKWQESERGQAYQVWMDAWDAEIPTDELLEPGRCQPTSELSTQAS